MGLLPDSAQAGRHRAEWGLFAKQRRLE